MCFPNGFFDLIFFSCFSILPAFLICGAHFFTAPIFDASTLALQLSLSFSLGHCINALICSYYPTLALLVRSALFLILSATAFLTISSVFAPYFEYMLFILAPIALVIQCLQVVGLSLELSTHVQHSWLDSHRKSSVFAISAFTLLSLFSSGTLMYFHFSANLLPSEASWSTLISTCTLASIVASIGLGQGTLLDGSLILMYNTLITSHISSSASDQLWMLKLGLDIFTWLVVIVTLFLTIPNIQNHATKVHMLLAILLSTEVYFLRNLGQHNSFHHIWYSLQCLLSSFVYFREMRKPPDESF